MKRDLELVRRILLEIEEQYHDEVIWDLTIPGYTMGQVAYHCKMLYDHGLVDDYNDQHGDGELLDFAVGNLTWEGHDYLETVRDDSFWGKTKQLIKDKGLPLTIDVVKDAANVLIAAAIGKITG